MSVRVRVGPSLQRPTSLGALRFILFNYAFAQAWDGSFVLRIEDTDGLRGRPSLLYELYSTLAWVGVDYHEGGQRGGHYGPYRQSERLASYARHARELIDAGVAYRCFCPPERLAQLRSRAERTGQGYDGLCAALDPALARDRAEAGEPHVVRMRVPRGGERSRVVSDEVFGDLTIPLNSLDDQVLLKSDGFPTYHFSSVVDDHLMRMTHVVRADVWLASTPKHLLLYDWFGWLPPRFVHVPAIRSGLWHTAVMDLRARGVPADAVVNFVATLGWRSERIPDVFGLRELTAAFELTGFSRACGAADPARLGWLSAQHLRRQPVEQAAEAVVPFLCVAGLPVGTAQYRQQALRLCLPHCRTYVEVAGSFGYLFAPPEPTYHAELDWSRELLPALFTEASRDFTTASLETHLRAVATRSGVGLRRLLDSVRLAVCGVRSTPDTFAVLALLGREECAARVAAALAANPQPVTSAGAVGAGRCWSAERNTP